MPMRTLRRAALPLLFFAASTVHADAKVCKAGALVFGDPMYVGGDKPNPKGQTVRQDPPLEYRSFVLAKGNLFAVSGLTQELWGGAVTGAVKRLGGEYQASGAAFADGPCGTARFVSIWGIAALRDGSLVVADRPAQALRLVEDPLGPGCKVTTLVGATAPFVIQDSTRPKPGDQDGPAKSARIGDPQWPVTDGSGNIYFIDGASGSVKMVAADAARTVTTLGQIKKDSNTLNTPGLTLLDDKLYAITNTFSNGLVYEIDPGTKKVTLVKDAGYRGFAPLNSQSPALTSITSDGTALLLTGQGYIWRMSKDGKVTTQLAGRGGGLDFPPKYNPAGVYPVKDVFLRFRNDDMTSGGTSTAMVWSDGALYWRGRHSGAFVVKIGCP